MRSAVSTTGWRSLHLLAACTAVLATMIGTLSALALVRFRVRARPLISSILLSPIIFPAIVLGLALLVFYHRVGIAATFSGLVAAHVLLTSPFVLRLVMASLAEFDRTLEEAARNLGAGVLRTFMRVTLPLIRPGVIAGALFAYAFAQIGRLPCHLDGRRDVRAAHGQRRGQEGRKAQRTHHENPCRTSRATPPMPPAGGDGGHWEFPEKSSAPTRVFPAGRQIA